MVYDEQLALEIIQRFGLNESTNAVWKNRGKIPDKYFREGFQIKQKATGKKDIEAMQEIRRIFGYGKLNSSAFSRLMDIKDTRLKDLLFNDIAATKDEIISLRRAINVIRLETRDVLSEISKNAASEVSLIKLRKFVSKEEIKLFSLFESRETSKKISDWSKGIRRFPFDCVTEIIQMLMVFIVELGTPSIPSSTGEPLK